MPPTLIPFLKKVCAGSLLFAPVCFSQNRSALDLQQDAIVQPAPLMADAVLPDSPGTISLASFGPARSTSLESGFDQAGQSVPVQIAPKYKRTIKADQTAVPLSAGDKLVFALRQRATPLSFLSTSLSAGYSHLTDGRPHYGTDSAGFGERFGSSMLRQTSQSLFNYGIYAAVFHDDPRYYVLGDTAKVKRRAIYAAERVVITRKDNGHQAINWPQLLGVASAQALANSYYPMRDQSVRRTVTGTLSSYGTNALTNEVNEFLGDVIAHLRHKPQP